MSKLLLRSLLGASALSMAIIGTANAGGFARGNADTDILYEDGNFNLRSSVTIISPSRDIKSSPNPDLNGTDYVDMYVVPSSAIKLNILDNLRCAATHVMNNGGDVRYAAPTDSGKLREKFDTYEAALTCGVKFEAGKGNFWLLGGGYQENFDYTRANVTPSLPGPVALANSALTLSGTDYGYRAGLAYEIKEIAFRAQLMYRSGTEYGADGELNVPTGALYGAEAQRLGALAQQYAAQAAVTADPVARAALISAATQARAGAQQALAGAYAAADAGLRTGLSSIGTGKLPQSVELKVQSGIAPGWLAFGSVKWTDWSTTTQLIVTAFRPDGSVARSESNDYFWKDGWTVTGGVGHAFNDQISGLVALTWDRGVGTGWDGSSDTYTVSAGGLFKDKWGGELRIGGAVSYLSSATETKYGDDPNRFESAFDTSYDSGWAVAGNIGYAIKW